MTRSRQSRVFARPRPHTAALRLNRLVIVFLAAAAAVAIAPTPAHATPSGRSRTGRRRAATSSAYGCEQNASIAKTASEQNRRHEMQRGEAAKLVAMLSAAYRDAPISEATAEVYEAMLADLDFAAGQQAVQRLICSSKWLPTVAEIRAAAADVRHGPVRAGGEAWGDVVEAIRRVGSYRPAPTFADPMVNDCVKFMGWRDLCLGTNEAADRAKFVSLYDSLAGRERAGIVAGALPEAPRGFALPAMTTLALPSPASGRRMTAAELSARLAELAPSERQDASEPELDAKMRQAGER